MTGLSDIPDRREASPVAPHTGPPYPYPHQYQSGAGPGGYPPPPPFGYPPAGYPPPPPYGGYPPPPTAPKNGFGITSLVLAVVGLLSVATVFAPIALGVVALIIGIVGHRRVKQGTANNGGVAIAGIVLGALAIVVGLAFIAIWTTVWKDVGGGDYIDCMQKAGSGKFEQQQCADQFRQNVQDRLSVTLTPAPVP